jgi:hypothetical protein
MEEPTSPNTSNLPTGKVVTAGVVPHFDARTVGSIYLSGTTRATKLWNLETFINKHSREFPEDQNAASRVQLVRAKAGTQEFDNLLNTSNRVKWVFTIDNELWAIKAKYVTMRQKPQEGGGWSEDQNQEWNKRRQWKEKREEGETGRRFIQETTHAVAANDLQCYAAGMAFWYPKTGGGWGLAINHWSGHYQPSPESVEVVGLRAWWAAGVKDVVFKKDDEDWRKTRQNPAFRRFSKGVERREREGGARG